MARDFSWEQLHTDTEREVMIMMVVMFMTMFMTVGSTSPRSSCTLKLKEVMIMMVMMAMVMLMIVTTTALVCQSKLLHHDVLVS